MIKNIWDDKVEEARRNFLLAQNELELAEAKQKEKAGLTGIEKWLGYDFESSSYLTEEYALFDKEVKKYIKGLLGEKLELVKWNRGHFYFSAFIKNKKTDKLVYISCSDVRGCSDNWFNNLLIRTAEHEKDYTGGSNDYCKLIDIREKAEKLTS
jgi:hypothetical protein